MADSAVEGLKDIADRCFMGHHAKAAFFQSEHGGIRYCSWLSSETDDSNRRLGDVICPFTDELAIVEIGNETYPLCNCYTSKPK